MNFFPDRLKIGHEINSGCNEFISTSSLLSCQFISCTLIITYVQEMNVQDNNLWTDSATQAPTLQALNGDQRCDVVIIGAGFTGLSSALHLAKSGVSVCVLEAKHIGYGGSGRNVGLVNAGLWLKPNEVMARMGEEAGDKLLSFLGAAPQSVFDLIKDYDIDCEAHHNGTLHCASSAGELKDLEDRYQQWHSRGAPISILPADETQKRLGTSYYSASLEDKRAGTVQPLSYVHGLAHAALSHGAQIFDQSPVVKAEQTAKGWKLSTANGTVEAEKVICSTNAYTEDDKAMGPPSLALLYYFQVATEPLEKALLDQILASKQGAWDCHTVLSSFRLDDAGRMIWGSIGRLDNAGASIHIDWARRALSKLYPALENVKFSHHWFGRIGLTGDNIPRFATPLPGWAMTWGYNGRGIAPGTVFGKALSNFVQNGDQGAFPLKQSPIAQERFVKTQTFAVELGAKAHHFISARF
jgi:glycine/D-amino acid oxidase-like deaminating enzyme